MLAAGATCSSGRNIRTYEECERAAASQNVQFIALKNNLTNCYATRRNFGGGEQRELCLSGGTPTVTSTVSPNNLTSTVSPNNTNNTATTTTTAPITNNTNRGLQIGDYADYQSGPQYRKKWFFLMGNFLLTPKRKTHIF